MKIWTFKKIEQNLPQFPREEVALKKLPTSFVEFDEWHKANMAKVMIAATVIGCQCVAELQKQEEELMNYRRKVCKTAKEWFKRYSNMPEHEKEIRRISYNFAQRRICHRNFIGPKAGIRCYCDEHAHRAQQ